MGPFVLTLKERGSGTVMLELTVERFEHHRDPYGDLLVAVRGDHRRLLPRVRKSLLEPGRPGPIRRAFEWARRACGPKR